METFGKGGPEPREGSATVAGVSRLGLRLGAASLLVLAGAASSLLAARPHALRATTTPAATTTSAAAVVVAFSGHGWGHGLGLGQWGAYGYAKHGWTYDRILAHYYTGTTLGTVAAPTVRVLVLDGGKKVTLAADAAWRVVETGMRRAAFSLGSSLARALSRAGLN